MDAAEIRAHLMDLHTYLLLAFGMQGNLDNRLEDFRVLLNGVSKFVETAKPGDFRGRGRKLVELLERAIETHSKTFSSRKPTRDTARAFRALGNESDVWRYGIPFGWLVEHFESSAFDHPADLPFHAKVGLGTHHGNASVEEAFLLEDAFFLLARAELAFTRMGEAADLLKATGQGKLDKTEYRMLSLLNGEACTFSRLTVVTSSSFVEAFVNSVGWNEALTRANLSDDARAELRGVRKERYSSLRVKLERFPKLIRQDGTTPIVISDPVQMKEPFLSFFKDTNDVRDASMHYAPGKAAIWRPPKEWISSAQNAVEHSVSVAREFWSACYPERPQPIYLDGLDHARFLKRARERVQEAEEIPDKSSPVSRVEVDQ